MQSLSFLLINALGALFQGIVGFGQSLVATPLALTILPKVMVLNAITISALFLNAYMAKANTEPLDRALFTKIALSSLLGMPLGILILKVAPINTLKVIVGSLAIVFVLLIVFTKVKLHNIKSLIYVVGFLCGVLQTSTSMAGPPIVLLLTSSDLSKAAIRKMLVSFFLLISAMTLIFYFFSGLLEGQGLLLGLATIPFVLLAGRLGSVVTTRIPPKYDKPIALITVILTGIIAILNGLHA